MVVATNVDVIPEKEIRTQKKEDACTSASLDIFQIVAIHPSIDLCSPQEGQRRTSQREQSNKNRTS